MWSIFKTSMNHKKMRHLWRETIKDFNYSWGGWTEVDKLGLRFPESLLGTEREI